MKGIKRFLSLIVAAIAIFSMVVPVEAEQIVNTGGGGGGSITITNASQGQVYKIYKLFDATQSADGIAYKLPPGKTLDPSNPWFEVDTAGNVLAKSGADISTTAFQTWAQGFGTEVASATATEAVVTFSNLAYGYYYVKSSLGAVLTVDSTNPNARVIDKNETEPEIPADGGKKIQVGGSGVDTTTAKIGETLDFTVTFSATNFITKNGTTTQITEYIIEDTPTALAINQASINVQVDGTTITPTVKTVDPNTGKMTIKLQWAQADGTTIYNSPALVVLSYSAVVTKDAQDGSASNQATIKFNGNELDDSTTITTYKLTLQKVNANDVVLTGAEFKLYDAETGGNEIPVVKNADGSYRVAEAGETGVPIQAGTAVIKGLKGNSNYWLEEIKAPAGYNVLTTRKKVTFGLADTSVKVVNQAGAELPATGSLGTTIFYGLGSVLVMISLIVLVSKRRMREH